jgi:hypothetical protein
VVLAFAFDTKTTVCWRIDHWNRSSLQRARKVHRSFPLQGT